MRAKLKLKQVTEFDWGSRQAVFSAEYDPTIPEDVTFNKATPNAELKMTVDNPAVFDQLKPGRVFYVDFTPVE